MRSLVICFTVSLYVSRGKKVIISVGGQNGTVTVNDAASASNFTNSVYGLIQQYGFDGVDIDFENGLNAATWSVTEKKHVNSLRALTLHFRFLVLLGQSGWCALEICARGWPHPER